MSEPQTISIPSGMVVCTTYGMLRAEMAWSLLEARSYTEAQGVRNISYVQQPGTLVDKVRNDAMRRMLGDPNCQWLLFTDADMTWAKEAFLQMLQTAYGTHPHFDVLGAYCSLRGNLCLPTIDTGTGTWESHYPGNGVVEVMRTGAAFLLIKRHVAERIPEPWFALRVPQRPLDAIAEVDTFCLTVFDGQNPFRNLPGQPWERMVGCAANHDSAKGQWIPAEVGEDSSFCDRVRNANLRIAVNTDIIVQHLHTVSQSWTDHKEQMARSEREQRLLSGLVA